MFIKSITFPKGHPFYNNGESIVFGDSQKDLIDFYLRTTNKIKEGEKYIGFGNNIQINCILGDNGVGKSRFLKSCHPEDRDDNSNKTKIVYSKKSSLKGSIKVIFDDFNSISSNHGVSIHKDLFDKYQKTKSLESIYIEIHGFIERNSTIKTIFRNFLNLDEEFDSHLYIKPNYEWYYDFGGSHVEFIETESKEGLDNFINKGLYKEYDGEWHNVDLLSIFQFLYSKSKNENLKEFSNLNNSINAEVAFEYWSILSDLFISLLNQFRNGIDFITNTKVENFIKLDNYKELKEILVQLLFFLEKNRINIENIKDKIHGEWSKKYFLGVDEILEYYDNISFSINGLFQIFQEIEGNNRAEAGKLSESIFGLSLHELLRHISGYEKRYVDANDYFLVELALKFQKVDPKKVEIIARTLQWIFYYIIRNPSQEKIRYNLDAYKIDFSQMTNISNKESVILSFPFFKVHFEFSYSGGIKSIEQLSGGEKAMLLRFSSIYILILKNLSNYSSFIVFIDEPDLHLHLDWQRQYIQRLIDVFSTIHYPDITFHFIIATHSPFIVSDLPGENIIRMRKDSVDGEIIFSQYGIENGNDKKSSFGANYIDIIQEGFFDNRLLMGSFAEDIIKNLAIAEKIKLSKDLLKDGYVGNKDMKEIEDYLMEGEGRIIKMKEQIGDEFIKNHLLYMNTSGE